MGGAAVIVRVDVEPRLVTERPPQNDNGGALASRLGSGDLPVGLVLLAPLTEAFRRFLDPRLRSPWPASQYVLSMLEPSTYVRRDHRDQFWMLQISFSSGAGECETSAAVAAHWVERWLSSELELLSKDLLSPAGVHPKGLEPATSTLFVPVSDRGYGAYTPAHEGLSESIQLDQCMMMDFESQGADDEDDTRRDGEPAWVRPLIQRARRFTGGRKCLCQLCAPEFKPGAISSGLEM